MLGNSLNANNKNSEFSHLYHFKSKTSILSGLVKTGNIPIFAQSSNNRTVSVESQRERSQSKEDPKRHIHVIPEKKKRIFKSQVPSKNKIPETNQTTLKDANNLIININQN